MSTVVKYTLARLLLFAVAWGLLYLAGARGLLALALAVLVSGLVSFVLLSRQRDEMSSRITGGVAEMRQRIDAGAAAEDAVAEEAAEDAAGDPPEAPERTADENRPS